MTSYTLHPHERAHLAGYFAEPFPREFLQDRDHFGSWHVIAKEHGRWLLRSNSRAFVWAKIDGDCAVDYELHEGNAARHLDRSHGFAIAPEDRRELVQRLTPGRLADPAIAEAGDALAWEEIELVDLREAPGVAERRVYAVGDGMFELDVDSTGAIVRLVVLSSPQAWNAQRELARAAGETFVCDLETEEAEQDGPSPLDAYREVLPALRGPDWPGRNDAIAARLIGNDPRTDQPIWALAIEHGPLTAYIGTLAESGTNVVAVEALALANLRGRPFQTRTLRERSADGEVIVLSVIEGALAAERILDSEAMLRVAASLGRSRDLLVAVPRTGLLVATVAGDAGEGAIAKLARRFHAEAVPEARISPLVFVVQDGKRCAVAV